MYYQIVVIGVFILSAINVEINHLLSSINGHYMTIYLQNINTIILRKTGKKEQIILDLICTIKIQ